MACNYERGNFDLIFDNVLWFPPLGEHALKLYLSWKCPQRRSSIDKSMAWIILVSSCIEITQLDLAQVCPKGIF